VDEAPHPYLRWPGNFVRFWLKVARRYDVCHLHWHLFDSAATTRLFFRTRVPKVWTVHNFIPHSPVLRDDLATTHEYLNSVDSAVWHSARSIADARLEFAVAGLSDCWHASDRVIPHMSFNGVWRNELSREAARRAIGIEPEAYVVGHFGPTHTYKGTMKILRLAAESTNDSVRYAVFGLCGDPALGRALVVESEALPNLKLHLAHVGDQDLQAWFNACDILVQPYTRVTTSGTIYFAIAFRRPIIASPMGNIPDVIEHRVRGWLASEPQEIAACLEEAMADSGRAVEMAEKAYRYVSETANVSLVAKAYERTYEDVVKS